MKLPKYFKRGAAKKVIFLTLTIGLLLFSIPISLYAQSTPPSTASTIAASALAASNPISATVNALGAANNISSGISESLTNITGDVIGKLAFYVSFVIAWIGGLCVGLMAWLITVMLGINNGVFQSVLVQTGFSATLAIANLGFVLGIIIIAIATILQRDNYGIKQLLWKLVAAAILVNFSLVIMAPIFGFSNNVTQYFLNCINGGCNSAGVNNSTNFAQLLVGAFNPQAGFALNAASTTITNGTTSVGILSATSGNLGNLFVPLMSIIFVALECIMVVIVLGTFVTLLFSRYIYIAVLAILMPFAWLCWIFPNLNSHWKKWWAEFIRWTLFAPIVIFFLYLAILTQGAMSASGAVASQSIATYVNVSTNPIFGNLATLFGAFFTPIITNLLNMIIMLGLSVAGLKVANDMGIKGADAGLKAAGAVKDGVVEFAGKRGKKTVRSAYRGVNRGVEKATGRGLTQRLQESRIRPLAVVGRGIASAETNRAMVAEAAKNVPDNKETFLRNMNGSMSNEQRMAYFQKGADKGWIDQKTQVNGKNVAEYLQSNEAVFRSYGQNGEGSTEEKARDKSGLTFHKDSLEATEAREGNAKLDAKRNVSSETIRRQAGVSDEDMSDYERILKKDQNPEDILTAAEEQKRDAIKKKMEKARSETGLSDTEQEEYDKNQTKIDKFNGKIKRLAANDPELVGSYFMDDEKARKELTDKGKDVPITLEPESIDRVRTSILSAFAEGFSPQNARGFIDAIGKKNNLEYFEGAVNAMKENNRPQFEALKASLAANRELSSWMRNNSGKALFGNLRELFELPKKTTQGRRRNRDDDEDEA